MADIYSKKKRSEIMSLIRSKNTLPEKIVFLYLKKKKKISFQRHCKKIIGKPDVAVPTLKRAVFIDGGFWHGWHFSHWGKRLPNEFWREKIKINMRRDKRSFAKLRRNGWKALRIWDHQLKGKNQMPTLEKIGEFLTK
ncbi:MAG: very short patch repair endonuclease [bacterium]|nr:very short patch repair endonuclease [bacterium]